MHKKHIVAFSVLTLFVAFNILLINRVATSPVKASGEIKPQDDEYNMLRAFWASYYGPDQLKTSDYSPTLIAKAKADECFVQIGYPEFVAGPPCDRGRPKINDTRIWSTAYSNGKIWFGTASNDICLISDQINLNPFKGPPPLINAGYVCEYGSSNFSPPLVATMGDWRPPKVYMYDPLHDDLVEKTPPFNDPWINNTIGLRAAGSVNNVIFLGGPSLGPNNSGFVASAGVNFFAYDGVTGEYIGSAHYDEYGDIRHTVTLNGVLYTAVGNSSGNSGQNGTVLRWDGQDPLSFEPVGKIEGLGAYLALHDNRLFVSNWPSQSGCDFSGETIICPVVSIFMSPEIPPGGLTGDHYNQWVKLWDVNAYEPDFQTAKSYGGGPLFSVGDYLYWTTMHVLNKAQTVHLMARLAKGDVVTDPAELNKISVGVTRASSIFRIKAVDGVFDGANAELVYGMPEFPVYDFDVGTWNIVPNKMGQQPLFGMAGLGNFYANYSWSTASYNGHLYLGMMDWSHMAQFSFPVPNPEPDCPDPTATSYPFDCGADIWRFDSADEPAQIVTSNGFGNYTNHGARTMISTPFGVYVGSTNSMNLMSDLTDDLPEGGWELRRIAPFFPNHAMYFPLVRH